MKGWSKCYLFCIRDDLYRKNLDNIREKKFWVGGVLVE